MNQGGTEIEKGESGWLSIRREEKRGEKLKRTH